MAVGIGSILRGRGATGRRNWKLSLMNNYLTKTFCFAAFPAIDPKGARLKNNVTYFSKISNILGQVTVESRCWKEIIRLWCSGLPKPLGHSVNGVCISACKVDM